ncbi:MAG: response regulator [Pseudomonadota bacterium]
MAELGILAGKRILAVDDEPDVLEVVGEELATCEVVAAGDCETARRLIATERFDLIILDIMGVDGFALLEESVKHKQPAAMLTAHALSIDNINRAIRLGAVSFLPKEELTRLPEVVAEILQCLEEGRSHWERLFSRLGPFFKERLGLEWEDLERPRKPPYMY